MSYGNSYNRGNSQRRPETVEQHWSGYLRKGYLDSSGNLHLELVGREQVEPLAKAMANGVPKLSTTQVRRYFGHVRALEAQLLAAPETERAAVWRGIQADFAKLDSAASYAYANNEAKIPELFWDFIKQNVKTVRTHDDFLKGFVPHFEALVGFGVAHFSK